MDTILGSNFWVFIFVDVMMAGGAAWMMGQALALTWRALWQIVPYATLLAASARFLSFALFHAPLLSLPGFAVALTVTLLASWFAFRVTRAGQMVSQYPWLFLRDGLIGWRAKS
jgi:branched-chain amino acid transport system ATP-binding protein